jgi:hypothetical protein
MLAECSLDKTEKHSPVVIGAFLLADPKGDKEEALRLFPQAAADGVNVAQLVRGAPKPRVVASSGPNSAKPMLGL